MTSHFMAFWLLTSIAHSINSRLTTNNNQFRSLYGNGFHRSLTVSNFHHGYLIYGTWRNRTRTGISLLVNCYVLFFLVNVQYSSAVQTRQVSIARYILIVRDRYVSLSLLPFLADLIPPADEFGLCPSDSGFVGAVSLCLSLSLWHPTNPPNGLSWIMCKPTIRCIGTVRRDAALLCWR